MLARVWGHALEGMDCLTSMESNSAVKCSIPSSLDPVSPLLDFFYRNFLCTNILVPKWKDKLQQYNNHGERLYILKCSPMWKQGNTMEYDKAIKRIRGNKSWRTRQDTLSGDYNNVTIVYLQNGMVEQRWTSGTGMGIWKIIRWLEERGMGTTFLL